MRIEFDAAKDEANRTKHGIALSEAARFDFDTAIIERDQRRDYGEVRFVGLGLIDGRTYVLVHTKRGDAIRPISLRKANDRERKRYGDRT